MSDESEIEGENNNSDNTFVERDMTDAEDLGRQLRELRVQLELAESNAAKEREELQRLQGLLNEGEPINAAGAGTSSPLVVGNPAGAGTSSPLVTDPAGAGTSSTPVTASAVAVSSYPSTSGTLGAYFDVVRTMPPPVSNLFSNPMTVMCPGVVGSYGAPLAATTSVYSVPRVPTFMPPVNSLYSQPNPVEIKHTLGSVGANVQRGQPGQWDRRRVIDLPEYTGRPEGWPMFVTAFVESTAMMQYTNVENMFRLQKSLKGAAWEAVESLLIHPNNVNRVMSALEFNFGRPECLVRSQLNKVREIQPIPEAKLELLIPLATKVQNLATFFEASGLHQHLSNPTLLEELVAKLPMSKRMEWAQYSIMIQPYATILNFEEWLTRVARLVSLVIPSAAVPSPSSDPRPKPKKVLHVVEQPKIQVSKCRHCDGEPHPVADCQVFKKLDVSERWIFVKKNRLCFSCLKFGHRLGSCKLSKKCGTSGCADSHHALLHKDPQPTTSADASAEKPDKLLLNHDTVKKEKVLFRVVPVRLYGKNIVLNEFALLDEGSSVSIIGSDLASRLGLRGSNRDLRLQWFGKDTSLRKSQIVEVVISADNEDAERHIMTGVYTVDDINLPTQTLMASELTQLSRHWCSGTFNEYQNAKPQLLIGLDHCRLGAPIRSVEYLDKGLILAETRLGWVVYGTSDGTTGNESVLHCSQLDEEEDMLLGKIVDEYLLMENFGVKKPAVPLMSAAEERALTILKETTVRVNDRYQTGLLLREDVFQVPESREMAELRLRGLQRRFVRDPEFATAYRGIIKGYLKKGYARKLSRVEAEKKNKRTWYLPHFGVKNPNKPQKVRLVFDAAAKVDNVSLNSLLMKGPDDRPPLVAVLFNFRMRAVAVSADIEEMYHQVLVRPEDQDLQRFLWQETDEAPVEEYVMQVMTFGAACSPCSAEFVKNLNASRFSSSHQRAVKSIVKHHYVDDYVDSFDSVCEAIDVTRAVTSIHKDGGFNLRSFKSSSKDVLRAVAEPNVDQRDEAVSMDIDSVLEKILGMCWCPDSDVFTFRLQFPRVRKEVMENDSCPTKRELLCMTMSIFDPFGLIANFVIYAKVLLQSVWKRAVKWDQPIPDEMFLQWKEWKSHFSTLMQISVPRCYQYLADANKTVLHIYVDASEEAWHSIVRLHIFEPSLRME